MTKKEILDPWNKEFIKQLHKIMVENKGMGISAVQVGILKQVFIVNVPGFERVIYNPLILKRSRELCDFNEGCLSFPGKEINVNRPMSITVKYLDTNAKLVYTEIGGLAARVFQHEYDHLRGIVFTTYENT